MTNRDLRHMTTRPSAQQIDAIRQSVADHEWISLEAAATLLDEIDALKSDVADAKATLRAVHGARKRGTP